MADFTRRRLLIGSAGLAGLMVAAPLTAALGDSLTAYADLLARYVLPSSDGINRVDYAAWQGASSDRQALLAFIEDQAQRAPSRMPAGDRFAYWTNLYNALTLAVVLDAYPVRSIKNIKSKGRLFDFKGFAGPWRTKLVAVEGRRLSLDDIEHGTMRPDFRDPRIHYAVNCASLGCPNLLARPWLASSLEADLDEAASAYVNHPRGVAVREDGTLRISSLYKWYDEDFGASDAGILRHLRLHAREPLAATLAGDPRVSADDYDWSLNVVLRSG